ncbi:MAG: NrfD/PsrC family molybdoenzyme membrane anchor subunit [Actinomycetota bacterium]
MNDGRPVALAGRDATTYYDLPAVKQPVWTWEVPLYFYVGGAAGAAATIGAVLQVLDGDDSERLVRRCRDIAATGTAVGTVLLISDLGRPERFLNMLRVFKPSSPLNVGSWILAAASTLSGGAALLTRMNGPARRVGSIAGLGAGAVGLPLSGYTAVLLAGTAVPVWKESRRSLPVLFVASATGAACSLLELGGFDEEELTAVRRLGTVAQLTELAAAKAVEKESGRVERVALPFGEGLSGTLWKASSALTIGSLAVDTVTGTRRSGRVAAALMGTAGSIALRFSVWLAGRASARDPRATFESQRTPARCH